MAFAAGAAERLEGEAGLRGGPPGDLYIFISIKPHDLRRAEIQRLFDALHHALPQGSRADAAWGYQFALGALLHHLVDDRIGRLSNHVNTPSDPAAAERLVRFIVGGLRATLPVAPPKKSSTPPSHRRQT